MKLLCRLIGCNWATDDIHSQLSVVCETLEPVPLECVRCGKTAWGKWQRNVGMTLIPGPPQPENPAPETSHEASHEPEP